MTILIFHLQLQQNEQLLDYHAAYRELMSWATEFLARMSSPELSENLQEATVVYGRHKLLHDEMKLRLETDFAVLVNFFCLFFHLRNTKIFIQPWWLSGLSRHLSNSGRNRVLGPRFESRWRHIYVTVVPRGRG